jgi:hypothetical protein
MALGLLCIPSSTLAKLHVLVTHTPPAGKVAALLDVPESDFRTKAEELGLVVTESEAAIYARPKNLYNLEFMRQCMDSFNVLRAMAASGQSYKKFSDLTTAERQNVRALFADSSLIDSYGPNIMDDSATFRLESKTTITLTNGRKDITVRLPDKSGAPPKDFVRDAPADEKLKEFRDKVLPTVKKENYVDALIFTFVKSDLISSSRTTAISDFTKDLTEALEGQRKAFVSARTALEAALLGGSPAVQGASWLTMDENVQRYINGLKNDNFASLGFDSKDAADAFFADARIKGVEVDPFVGVGVRLANGSVVEAFTTVKVNRNSPP